MRPGCKKTNMSWVHAWSCCRWYPRRVSWKAIPDTRPHDSETSVTLVQRQHTSPVSVTAQTASMAFFCKPQVLHHTHTHLTTLCPGLPGWASTRKVTPIWILLKQETVSGSGISWAVCKSAPRSRQTTMPAPHYSVFTGPSCRRTNSVKALKFSITVKSKACIKPSFLRVTVHPRRCFTMLLFLVAAASIQRGKINISKYIYLASQVTKNLRKNNMYF